MHIVSTINPQTKSSGDVRVFLLCYGDQRVFVHKAETYEELDRIAREELEIDDDTAIVFETSSPDVCNGQNARITRRAYDAMWPFLDVISVVHNASNSTTKASVTAKTSQPVASTSSQARRAEPPTPQPTPPVTGPTDITAQRESSAPMANESEYASAGPSSPKKSRQRRHGKAARRVDSEPETEVTEFEEEAVLTPHHRDVPDSGIGSTSAATETSQTRTRATAVKQEDSSHEDEHYWDETDPGNFFNSPGPSRQSGVARHLHSSGMFAASSSQARNSARVTPSPARTVVPTQPAPRSPNNTQNHSRSLSQSVEPSQPVDLAVTNDQRFKVTIYASDVEYAEFMTRGRHTVRKVLSGACNRFGLDFDSCNLYLERGPGEEDEDNEDADEENWLLCSKTGTMSGCGVSHGAKLHVRVDE